MITETKFDAKYASEITQPLQDFFATSDGTIEEEIAMLSQLTDHYMKKRSEAYTKMHSLRDEIRVLERKLGELGVELLSKIDDK
jgi:predicted component of viral defense system (DUF524 family)